MRSLKSIPILVCLLLGCSCAWAAQIDWEMANIDKVANPPVSIKLEYKFVDDETRRYDVTLAGEGMLKLPGQDQETKLVANSDLTFVDQVMPKSGSDEIWHISRKLVKGQMTIPDFGKLPVAAPQLVIDMDKCGAVRTIRGLDQLSTTFGLPPDQQLQDVISQLKFVGFPKKELKVNDSWDESYTVQLAGQKAIAIKATSTLVGFDRVLKTDCATILTKYEVPFSFSLDAADAKPSADDKTSAESASAQKGKALVGNERGEFRTYFAYADGKIMQSYGTIELTADLDGGPKTADDKPTNTAATVSTTPEAKPGAPAPAASAASNDTPKHSLSVKYYVTSIFNPVSAIAAKQAGKGVTP